MIAHKYPCQEHIFTRFACWNERASLAPCLDQKAVASIRCAGGLGSQQSRGLFTCAMILMVSTLRTGATASTVGVGRFADLAKL